MRKLARSGEKRLFTKGKYIWESVKITEKQRFPKEKQEEVLMEYAKYYERRGSAKQERKKAGKHVSGQHQRAPAWLTGWGCWGCCRRKLLPWLYLPLVVQNLCWAAAHRPLQAERQGLSNTDAAVGEVFLSLLSLMQGWSQNCLLSVHTDCCCSSWLSEMWSLLWEGDILRSGSYFMYNFMFLYVLNWICKGILFFNITRIICLSILHSGWDTFVGPVLNIYTSGSDSRKK